ncbi:MAG: T9SS type A sorting domain-containing protein, partial [Ignavibacteria bacterium]
GVNWVKMSNGITDTAITEMYVKDNLIFASTLFGNIFRSTDDGKNWTSVNSGLNNTWIRCYAEIGNDILAGTDDGVYRSTSDGVNWFKLNPGFDGRTITSIQTEKSIIYTTSSDSGFHLSTDNGSSWIPRNSGLVSRNLTTMCIKGNKFWVNDYGNAPYYSTDQGLNWIRYTYGLFYSPANENYVSGPGYLYSGTGLGVFRLSDSTILNINNSNIISSGKKYYLYQNFPNPFNSSTRISYFLETNSFVSLKIYDMLGKEIKTMVSEYQDQGNHNKSFNSGDLASGIYFYKIEINGPGENRYIQTKRMVLLK